MAQLAGLLEERDRLFKHLQEVTLLVEQLEEVNGQDETTLSLVDEVREKYNKVNDDIARHGGHGARLVPPNPPRSTGGNGTSSPEGNASLNTYITETSKHDFKVNDKVLAKWREDRQFYPARVVSVSGAKSDPVYTVIYDGYKDTETLRSHQIKGLYSKKRKLETVATQTNATEARLVAPAPKSAAVISAAARINPVLAAESRQESIKASDDSPRPAKAPRKLNATETANRKKDDWTQFRQSQGKKLKGAKGLKSNSMFRTKDDRPQPGAPGARAPARNDSSRHRLKFDDLDAHTD